MGFWVVVNIYTYGNCPPTGDNSHIIMNKQTNYFPTENKKYSKISFAPTYNNE